MSCYITISNITGEPPYEITVCDNYGNNCFLAAYELSYVPPTIYVDIPSDWSLLPFVQVTVESSEGCEELQFVQTTPTPTPSNTPTPTPSPSAPPTSPTPTPSITPSITPSKSIPIPPYFEVQNVNGSNPQTIVLRSLLNSKFTVDFGNGDPALNYSIINPAYTATTNVALSKSYASGDYTTTLYDLRYGSPTFPNSAAGINELYFGKISGISANTYTFTAFTNLDSITITGSTVEDFSFYYPVTFDTFTYDSNSASTFNFEIKNSTNLGTVLYRYNSFTSATINYSGYTTPSRPTNLSVRFNSFLTQLNFGSPQTGSWIYLANNSVLSNFNFLTPLSSSTTTTRVSLDSNRITGWTENFPTSVTRIDLDNQAGGLSGGANSFKFFQPNLNNNTNLSFLYLYNNSLTSVTDTISACTSLSELRLDRNRLQTIPQVLPNSISTLWLQNNFLTGYTSNFPTSTNDFNIGSLAGGYNNALYSWDVELTGATNLQYFQARQCSLTGWTKTFPTSILSIDLQENNISAFTNSISAATSLITLKLNNNDLLSLPPIFPNSIQNLYLDNNQFTGYTSNIPTSLEYINVRNQFAIGNYIPEWTQELTGATNLNEFDISRVGLTAWTKNFPSSIRTIDMSINDLTNINLGLMTGVTNISFASNNSLSAITNLSAATSLNTIYLNSTNFKTSSDIIQGDFPSTLKIFSFNLVTSLTGWTNTFSALTGFTSGQFTNTGLKTAAVDYLLQDFYNLATARTLTNKTLLLSGLTGTQPESPTGGLTNPYYLGLKNSPYNWTVTVKP